MRWIINGFAHRACAKCRSILGRFDDALKWHDPDALFFIGVAIYCVHCGARQKQHFAFISQQSDAAVGHPLYIPQSFSNFNSLNILDLVVMKAATIDGFPAQGGNEKIILSQRKPSVFIHNHAGRGYRGHPSECRPLESFMLAGELLCNGIPDSAAIPNAVTYMRPAIPPHFSRLSSSPPCGPFSVAHKRPFLSRANPCGQRWPLVNVSAFPVDISIRISFPK